MHTLFPLVLCWAATVNVALADDHDTAFSAETQQDSLVAQVIWRHPQPEDDPALVLHFDPMRELLKSLHVMQHTWYALSAGTWPTGIDWTRAVFNTHLVASAASLTRRAGQSLISHDHCKYLENEIDRYFSQTIAYYYGEDDFAIRHQAYDDMLWVVLGWLEGIRLIEERSLLYQRSCGSPNHSMPATPWHGTQFIHTFAQRAESFWNLTTKGWDTHYCGGGMVWNPRLAPYKNAITNQLFISASVGMYLYLPARTSDCRFDAKHLNAAIAGYDWLKHSGMTNEKGLYVDGFHVRDWKDGGTECNERNEMVYTYNQGVLLSGLRQLWEATGDVPYLRDAHELAHNAIHSTNWALEGDPLPSKPGLWAGLGRSGVLEERCDSSGTCNQDGQAFKGIFMHHLALLCERLPLEPAVPGKTFAADRWLASIHRNNCEDYSRWVLHNAEAALKTRDDHGRFGGWWGARFQVDDLPPLSSALDYRNNASELLSDVWIRQTTSEVMENSQGPVQGKVEPKFDSRVPEQLPYKSFTKADLNDRGRGRTVETQSGGVALLRALWELPNTDR